MRHTVGCEINTRVCGDHAYCECECHGFTKPAVEPSRERLPMNELEIKLEKARRALYEINYMIVGVALVTEPTETIKKISFDALQELKK